MSAVTLETLRAEFEAEWLAYRDWLNDWHEVPSASPLRRKPTPSPEQITANCMWYGPNDEQYERFKRIYELALKLSDGAIDPRGEGQS